MNKMRIIFFTVFVSLLHTELKAQGYYAYHYSLWNNINYHQNYKYQYSNVDSYALANHIYTITKTSNRYVKNGSAAVVNESYYFDRFGRCITHLEMRDTGNRRRINYLMKRSFNENGQMSDNSYSTIKRFSFYQVFEYNDSNRLTLTTSFNNKERITGQTAISYNPLGREEFILYKGNNGKLMNSYHYHYYPDGKLKQVVLSDKRGKLIRVTDYSCDEAGKTAKKIKDTAKICTVKSYMPDGSIMAVTQYFDYRGHPVKIIRVTDSNNLLLTYAYYFGLKEVLHYGNTYTYSNGKLMKYEERGLDSKNQAYVLAKIYDDYGRIVNQVSTVKVSKSKNTVTQTEYFYNENGLLTGERELKDGQLKIESKLSYSFYEDAE